MKILLFILVSTVMFLQNAISTPNTKEEFKEQTINRNFVN